MVQRPGAPRAGDAGQERVIAQEAALGAVMGLKPRLGQGLGGDVGGPGLRSAAARGG